MDEAKSMRKSKYLRRGDLDRMSESRTIADESSDKQAVEGHAAEELSNVTKMNDGGGTGEQEEERQINLPKSEIIRRLRMRDEPICIFGEDLIDTFRRLRDLELHAPLDDIKERQRNDYMDAMNAIESENVAEELGQNAIQKREKNAAMNKANAAKFVDIKEKLESEVKVTEAGIYTSGDDGKDQKLIRQFLKSILATWAQYLEDRPLQMKISADGKNASATFRQTELYIKPLLKHLKHKSLEIDLIELLTEIMVHLNRREYQMANDAYMRMSIGRAAWPMGVTQVGIHSRTGREKIAKQAHVLNDETKRKYIQALKRVMTYCQSRWTTDPSKSMEFKAVISQLYPDGMGDEQTYVPSTSDGNEAVIPEQRNLGDRFE